MLEKRGCVGDYFSRISIQCGTTLARVGAALEE